MPLLFAGFLASKPIYNKMFIDIEQTAGTGPNILTWQIFSLDFCCLKITEIVKLK